MRRAHRFILLSLSAFCLIWPVEAQTAGGLIKRTPGTLSDNRVTVDVQVTNAAGEPLTGLNQQDLTLLDNGHPVTLTSFHEMGGAEAILLVDAMNASFQDVVIERQGIDAFLRQNGGRLALPVSVVFLTDTGVKLGKASRDGNSLADDLKKLPTPMRVIGTAQGAEGAQDRAQRSVRALQLLTTYEAATPGRKLVIWVGPGWPLLSRTTVGISAQDERRYFDSIVDLTTNLRRAHITLYSVAPLNLAQITGQNPRFWESFVAGVEDPAQADSSNLAVQVLATHSGGLVLGQSGDLAGQIARCLADGRDYYEMSFDAAAADAAIQYRALQVKPRATGASARTSTSYYAGVSQSASSQPLTASSPAPAVSAPPVIAAEARLVVVDVTVLDKAGLPIKGLANYFQLLEDNAPQKIVSVEEHHATATPIAAAPTTAPEGTLIASNKPPPGSVWNIILIDLYNTPKENRGRLQSQLEQFLMQLPEHQPLALVTMTNHIKIETTFEDGAAAAYRYLHKFGLGPADGSTPANIIEHQEVEMPSADIAGTSIQHQADIDVDRQADRGQVTLDCFSDLAQWLAPYPGRKNVYWLSGGFPLEGRPLSVAGFNSDTKGGHPMPLQQKLDKELESARVAIYPVDSSGVAAPNADGVSNADSTYSGHVSIVTALDDRGVAERHDEMQEIARATGGTAQFNNKIAQALSDDFSRASTYYTVAYTPPGKQGTGEYHRIQISVDKPGAQLIYRQGYAATPETPVNPTPEQFKNALQLHAFSPQAVQFTSQITTSGNQATAEYSVEPTTVDFREDASGQFLTDIDFAILEYDAKGKVLENSLIRLSGKMTAEQRAHLSAKALSTRQTIALKAGATTLVLGVRDQISGRFGTVEVPLKSH